MSRLESNMDELEKQLAELQMIKDSNTNRIKKIPPAVPPKKKAQPQVPHSAVVTTLREPSYSTKITPQCNANNNSTYSTNLPGPVKQQIHKTYANIPNHAFGQAESKPVQNYSTYSNLPTYRNSNDDLPPPPPPPPPPPTLHIAVPQYLDDNYNTEMLPPPSPVSSNYSELVRATTNLNYNQDRSMYPPVYQNEFPEYGGSQSSNYESLYEPINPNPHNSAVSVNDSYHHYENNLPHPNIQKTGKSPLPKEEEVDALTNLLIQSISDSQDLDVFGTCIKCSGKVIGEGAGCTAMGYVYHVKCFSCHICSVNLQGKPFYAVEGQPYCEADYHETLEKCSVCNEPILDRILRATGKPYHPTCFTCVVCGKSLDGVPFTVDAMNQIHCIEDFHKKFAPRCCVCELPIMPEDTVRVVALDRSFHVRCYCCEDCGLQLSSESQGRGCYPLDGHILCKTCNAQRIRQLTNVMTTDL